MSAGRGEKAPAAKALNKIINIIYLSILFVKKYSYRKTHTTEVSSILCLY